MAAATERGVPGAACSRRRRGGSGCGELPTAGGGRRDGLRPRVVGARYEARPHHVQRGGLQPRGGHLGDLEKPLDGRQPPPRSHRLPARSTSARAPPPHPRPPRTPGPCQPPASTPTVGKCRALPPTCSGGTPPSQQPRRRPSTTARPLPRWRHGRRRRRSLGHPAADDGKRRWGQGGRLDDRATDAAVRHRAQVHAAAQWRRHAQRGAENSKSDAAALSRMIASPDGGGGTTSESLLLFLQ